MKIDDFSAWMSDHTTLSNKSIYKYTRAVHTISNDMRELGVIHKSIFDMNTVELDISIARIIANPQFIAKNSKGNNMYSNSLKQYRYFFNTIVPAEPCCQ